jgi:dTDP-4-dehydrorhamnose reductase
MLGASVALLLKKNKIPFVGTSSDVDARDYKKLREFAEKWESDNYLSARQKGLLSRFNWIVNCSGYTAVEKAESEKEAARALNVTAASNIARVARELGAKMIHISSDYVFDGKASSPYTEGSPKNPLGVYGQTKSAGEDEIQKMMTQYFIIRTSWLYGRGRPNFVKTMARLMNSKEEIKVVNDQYGSPTNADDLAEAILLIIRNVDKAGTNIFSKEAVPYGIYHFSNAGQTSWFDFAVEIQRLLKKRKLVTNDCKVLPCSTEEYGAKVKRPAYSVLSKEKIQAALKIKIPGWKDSLNKFIKAEQGELLCEN